ncbi:MAG: hypothetical protein AAGA94_03885 [Pseudomonadota bacterium]
MRIAVLACLAVLAAVVLYATTDFSGLMAWAVDVQRGFQNQMATAIRGLQAGEPGAYVALLSATAAYGFVHALGPGHGKYLVGGVGLGTSISTGRLMGLAISSSVAQAMWAILLVYGGFYVIEATAQQMTAVVEDALAPASYIAIACVGLALVWRGVRSLKAASKPGHDPAAESCGCHSHGPTPDEAAQVQSLRDAAALVLSIAIRPCTGAIFLLVIAWQMDFRMPGAIAVLVMGLGTAMLTSLVAVSSTAVRGAVFASTNALRLNVAVPAIQVCAGTLIAIVSFGLLGFLR